MEKVLDNNRAVWDMLHKEGYKGYTEKPRIDELLVNLPERWLTKDKTLLEIGCGIGHFMETLAPLVGEIHGIDISAEAVKLGRKRLSHLENAHFHVTAGNELSMFKENQFDLIYSMACFQHIPRQASLDYLRACKKIIKEEGYIIVQFITRWNDTENQGDIGFIDSEETIGYNHDQLQELASESGLYLDVIKLQKLRGKAKDRCGWLWLICRKGLKPWDNELEQIEISQKDRSNWEQNIACNLCGSKRSQPYLHISKKEKNWYERDFILVECSECGLIRADPRPTFESWFPRYIEHKSEYFQRIFEQKLNRPGVRKYHRSIVRETINKTYNAKTLFDMGTGAGTVLVEAQKLGLLAVGNDINGYAVEQLRKLGIDAHAVPTSKLELNEKFDIITILDYIEHTYTPLDDLKWARQHINQGGTLFLNTMWLGCPSHQRDGNDWRLLGMGHFHYFTPEALRRIVEKAGFTIIDERRGHSLITIIAKPVLSNDELRKMQVEVCKKHEINRWFYATMKDHKRCHAFLKRLNAFLKNGASVLDVGGGLGKVGAYLMGVLGYDLDYVNLDKYENMLIASKELFKRLNLELDVKQVDLLKMKKLPFKSNSFDNVFYYGISCEWANVENNKKIIGEIRRVLKKNGVLSTNFIEKGAKKEAGYKQTYSVREIKELMRGANLKIDHLGYCNKKPTFNDICVIARKAK